MSSEIDRRQFVSLLVGVGVAGVAAKGAHESSASNDFAAAVEALGLAETEWGMGNGQCWECYGLGPAFERDPLERAADGRGGHEPWCRTAAILQAADRDITWKTRDVCEEPTPDERHRRLRRHGR